MNPKQKANDLVVKLTPYAQNNARQCAVIAVDEIISIFKLDDGPAGSTYSNPGKYFWMQVKNELNKNQI